MLLVKLFYHVYVEHLTFALMYILADMHFDIGGMIH